MRRAAELCLNQERLFPLSGRKLSDPGWGRRHDLEAISRLRGFPEPACNCGFWLER